MSTLIHFIDVGQGNMVLLEAANGSYYLCDCNVTDDNEDLVLGYVAKAIGWGTNIAAFICTHRDADHMRGVKKVHENFPIGNIWDSGHPGTTTSSSEYREYMELRRVIGSQVRSRKTYQDFGSTRLRYLSATDERLEGNANAQGLVIKVEHWNEGICGSSTILTGSCFASKIDPGIASKFGPRHGAFQRST